MVHARLFIISVFAWSEEASPFVRQCDSAQFVAVSFGPPAGSRFFSRRTTFYSFSP
jgi:hypothetical protein